jgi:DNA-binding transcriptional LysR family regulator
MKLGKVDLNLLIVFEALLAEQHVSRAAERIGRSQPAVSNSLGRLRDLFGDPLFVRTPQGMVPTSRARELRPLIEAALQNVRSAIEGAPFDRHSSTRGFSIASADGGAAHFLPRLLPLLRSEAPKVTLAVIDAWANEAIDALMKGSIDFALGVFPVQGRDYVTQDLMTVREVCVADARNTEFQEGEMSLERFLEMPKVVLERGATGNALLPFLATSGYTSNTVLTLPNFLVAARAVLDTDLIVVLPEIAIQDMPDRYRFAVRPLPFEVPDIKVKLAWNRQRELDQGLVWMRRLIEKALA